MKRILFLFTVIFLFTQCSDTPSTDTIVKKNASTSNEYSFKQVPSATSKVNFKNTITETVNINFYNFEHMYNGGGVAVGDINNDGLVDIYFTGNQEQDRLYLNKGKMQFEDITAKAITAGTGGWHTGVTMADVNGDGNLDIYVCRSGLDSKQQGNLLYINNGDLTFTESAEQYGIKGIKNHVQSSFFDYDNDGDLDLYVLSHLLTFKQNLTTNQVAEIIKKGSPSTDRLYRNDGGKFTDVSYQAGINNFAYGLGVLTSDINLDGYPDIYVANDFDEPDFMYINNGNGTFTDKILTSLKHTSNFSMGVDIADFNNDLFPDIAVVDMAFPSHFRSKTNMPSMRPEKFYNLVNIGWGHQYMRNVMQLNNGNNTFSDIAQMAGTDKTDWSWSSLFADFNNDGWKDYFTTNGLLRDMRNNDFKANVQAELKKSGGQMSIDKLISILPETTVSNYIFENNKDLTFTNVTKSKGNGFNINSNGAIYADLDQDGDLDIVMNNINKQASILENTAAATTSNNYLQIKLNGPYAQTQGAKVYLINGEDRQYQEAITTRGFQSGVVDALHYGVGDKKTIEKVVINWTNGKQSIVNNVKTNQRIKVDINSAVTATYSLATKAQPLFAQTQKGINFKHKEKPYDDFAKEILLPHKQSEFGPALASGDVNGDGLDDFYVGGSSGQSGELYIQNTAGQFEKKQTFSNDLAYEDTGALFFDADGDKDLDMYVVSGGNGEVAQKLLQDRLYINTNGQFKKSNNLPVMLTSGKSVCAGDMDGDGDLDLFVGGRVSQLKYPLTPNSYLLENDNGKFLDVTASKATELSEIGMITDAEFADMDGDNDLDLVISGEWMPITIMENAGKGTYKNATQKYGLSDTNGWWMSITVADIDADGDLDVLGGNIGKNNKFHPSKENPLQVHASDFDNTGSIDVVLSKFEGSSHYPVRGKECTSEQMPFINEKFPSFDDFASAQMVDIYSKEKLEDATHLNAYTFESALFINNSGKLRSNKLPNMAQMAPLMDAMILDINKDGHQDIIGVGNMYGAEVETTRYDAGVGTVLIGDGSGKFQALSPSESGLFANKQARQIIKLNNTIVVANNNDMVQSFELLKK